MKKLKIKLMVFFVIAVIFTTIGYKIAEKNVKPEIKETVKVVEKNIGQDLQSKINILKTELMIDLQKAEIQGYEHLDLIIVFDPLQKNLEKCRSVGGVKLHCYSFGKYNFKIATVQHYYQKFFNASISDKEAMNIALDDVMSHELARKIIFNEVGGIWNWENSAKKINAKERIEFIRSLEK